MEIYQKLMNVQSGLKAPKSQTNTFGKYKYRSAEDILEAVKPLMLKYNLAFTVSDEIKLIGERYYIEATVKVFDIIDGESVETKALAREEESKKGMDGSQVTGTASSYARKYALNGMFAIDDTKDADSLNVSKEYTERREPTPPPEDDDLPWDKPTQSSKKCSECGTVIDSRVSNYSTSKFGRPLCRDCQKIQ